MRDTASGVIWVNLPVILAFTSAVRLVLVRASDLNIARARIFSDAARGLALIQGAEASAMAALRRDMIAAPAVDHLRESWTEVGQSETRIEGGTFALDIPDAQSRVNLDSLTGSGVVGTQTLTPIAAWLELPQDTAPRILARLATGNPLRAPDHLIPEAGPSPETLARLQNLVTLVPGRQVINLNTAPADLIFARADNPVQALSLTSSRNGYLTSGDVVTAYVILPAGTGFISPFYEITTLVTVGRISQSRRRLLWHHQNNAGLPDVAVIARNTKP